MMPNQKLTEPTNTTFGTLQSARITDIRPPAGFYGNETQSADTLDLSRISKSKQTEEMVARAVQHSALNLQYASKRQMSREICLHAVSRCGSMIGFVPKRFIDEEMCRTAFEQEPLVVRIIPEQYQTQRMWKVAVVNSPQMLDRVPERFLDEEICILAVRQSGSMIEHVPDSMRTSRVCHEAVMAGGEALRHIPEDQKDRQTCLDAVRSNGMALEFVPTSIVDNKIIVAALTSDGAAIQFLPKNKRTKARSITAVQSNASALFYVPDRFKTEEFCGYVLDQNPSLIGAVPEALRTRERCKRAVEDDWRLLQYVPSNKKDEEICAFALSLSWRALRFFPKTLMTVDYVAQSLMGAKDELESHRFRQDSLLKEIVFTVASCPIDVMDTPVIAQLERQLGIRVTLHKAYDANSKGFIVVEKEKRPNLMAPVRTIVLRFDSFKKFREYVAEDLSGADLSDFDFKGVDLSGLDLSDVSFNPEIVDLSSTGIRLYNEIGLLDTEDIERDLSLPDDSSKLLHDSEIDDFDPENQQRLFYITDIHLDHCIRNRFPMPVPDAVIEAYVAQLVNRLVEERRQYDDRTYLETVYDEKVGTARNGLSRGMKVWGTLLIGGDVSHNFTLAKVFFKQLAKRWQAEDIVVILGNHELWESEALVASTAEDKVAASVQRYREMLEPLGITLLHDELLMLMRGTRWVKFDKDTILDEDKGPLVRYAADRSPLVVFGGIGFSGNEPKYNASMGIYRSAIPTLDDDRRLTISFSLLYRRVVELLAYNRLVVFTHMPYWEWGGSPPVKGWLYVSGHTHHNKYCNNEDLVLLADNQIGYYRTDLSLKHFIIRKRYDIFEMYDDGIYLIDDHQYIEFNRGLGIKCVFTRGDQVLMLKRAGFYMFVYSESGKHYLLEGGCLHSLDHQDLNYYYRQMPKYAEIVEAAIGTYMDALERISKAVKAFGGEGRIHGAIVDIDHFSHIYLNPFDGSVSYYYATSIVDKHFYADLASLLSAHVPSLLPRYTATLHESGEGVAVLSNIDAQLADVKNALRVIDTTMYRPSRVLRSIQYLFDTKVIRVWNEEALNLARIRGWGEGLCEPGTSGPLLPE